MPARLSPEFATAALVVVKSDVNHRRLVGDLQRPASASFAERRPGQGVTDGATPWRRRPANP
jgi:hypothetical protein